MDYIKIDYFIKVAETLSFSKAAKELFISHQALSKQIQLLEIELQTTLFERTTSKVKLTETGKKMYDLYKPLSIQYEKTYNELKNYIKHKSETLRIGFFNGIKQNEIVMQIVNHLLLNTPNLHIDFLAADFNLLEQLLAEDSIDLVISVSHKYDKWKDLCVIPIDTVPAKIIVSKNHPWNIKHEITVEDIANESMVFIRKKNEIDEKSFFRTVSVKEQHYVQNIDSLLVNLNMNNCFGIVDGFFDEIKELDYQLFDLPEEYNFLYHLVCVHKKEHPLIKSFKSLNSIIIKKSSTCNL